MTLVGCMEDGLMGKPDLLLIKGTMDLISSAFLLQHRVEVCGRHLAYWSFKAH